MNFRISLFCLIGFSILVTSCANEAKPSPTTTELTTTFSNFYIRYLQDDQELKAEAIFKIGDSLKTAQAQVIKSAFFEDTAMELKDLGKNGFRYRSKNIGQTFKGNYLFKANINENQSFDYPMQINPVSSFFIKEKVFSRSKGVTIVWDGKPLAKGELLVVFFINPDKKPVSLTINGPSNNSEIFLEAKTLERLKIGKGKVRLIRKSLNQLSDEPKNIESVFEYYTTPIDIDIAS